MTALQQKALDEVEKEYNLKQEDLERRLLNLEREMEALEKWYWTKLESFEKEWLN